MEEHAVAAHFADRLSTATAVRPRLTGPNYRGQHRTASPPDGIQPGSLLFEPGSNVPSSVIRLIDSSTALVRHVGSADDHPVQLSSLQPLGARVRVAADFNDSH
jgi:hypothetical protein